MQWLLFRRLAGIHFQDKVGDELPNNVGKNVDFAEGDEGKTEGLKKEGAASGASDEGAFLEFCSEFFEKM